MQSYLIRVGDPPIQVHGTYSVHLHSPGPTHAQLETTHFIDLRHHGIR